MKRIILMFSFIAGITVMAQAQITQKTPEQRAGHITKVLQKTLNLTSDQATQVYNAYLSQATRIDSLKSNMSADKKANNRTRKDIMLTTQQQVTGALNADQQKQFLQWEQMRKEKHQAKKPASTQLQG